MYGTCCLFPWFFHLQISYLFVHFFTFHWLFQFFSSRQLKRYLKLLLLYSYFSFAIWVSSCQTRRQHCCFCNGRSKSLVLGLKWGSQFCISCHHPELGTWLRTPWGVACTVPAKADWQASEQTMKSQTPFTCRKKHSKGIKVQRRALEQSDIGFRRAVTVRLLRLSMSTQRGGLLRPFRLGSCLRSAFKFWAVSAKPLQHQARCFRLSKLLWLVLRLFRLLTLKLRYILSQLLYIAGRDGLFAKKGIGWGGLKRQGKDFGFLVATWNLPTGWI